MMYPRIVTLLLYIFIYHWLMDFLFVQMTWTRRVPVAKLKAKFRRNCMSYVPTTSTSSNQIEIQLCGWKM